MKPGYFLSIINKTGLIFTCVWVLFWLVSGALFSHPNAEDLSLTLLPRDIGIFSSIKYTLATYDGRYFINFMHAVNPLIFNWINGYKWVTIFSIIAFTFSLYFFFSSVLSSQRFHLFILSILFVVIHFAIVPSLVHQLYWMVSSFVYLYVWIFGLIFAGSFFRSYNIALVNNSAVWLYIAAILLFCTIGINEMILPFIVTFLLLLLYLTKSLSFFKDAIFISLIGFVSIIFFIASPGILERVAGERQNFDINYFDIIFRSIMHYFRFLYHFFTCPILICSILLCFNYSKYFTINENIILLFKQRKVFNLILLSLIVSYIMTLTYYLPIGHQPFYPDRIYNTITVLIMLSLFFTIVYYSNQIKKVIPSSNLFTTLLIILTLLSLLFSKNNISKLQEEFSSGSIKNYHLEMTRRYEHIAVLNNTKSCYKIATVGKLSNIPTTISIDVDIAPNRKLPYWNNAYESYFNIDKIQLESDTVSFLNTQSY